MKKGMILLMSMALLLLPACGGGSGTGDAYDIAKTPAALLESEAFSEQLEVLDLDIACSLYGLDETQLVEGVVYASGGMTAEEIGVFRFKSEADAKEALPALNRRLSDQKAAYESYLPVEVPKLDAGIVSQKGATLLYVVASDADAARAVLDGR